jgi:hypothetical protein
MVARHALDVEIGVRIPTGQLEPKRWRDPENSNSKEYTNSVAEVPNIAIYSSEALYFPTVIRPMQESLSLFWSTT